MISPELQDNAVAEYCVRRDEAVVAMLIDLDLCGRFWKRRQVERAVTMIELRVADVLVVSKWSRVSRNRRDWAAAVARGVLAELAAYESERAADGFRETQVRRVRLGLPPWRPPASAAESSTAPTSRTHAGRPRWPAGSSPGKARRRWWGG
jgi:hypothetical protein